MNPAVALARVLVDELARHGVRHVVVAPGSRSAPLALAAYEHRDVVVHVRIDERSAGFLALGLARGAFDRPVAAVVCTSGTATANLHPAVLEADAAGVPMLVLTADRPPELRGTGANQTVVQIGLYGGAVRWACEVGVPEPRAGSVPYWRSVASRAVAESAGSGSGPPGPVHLNVALREPLVGDDDEPFVEPLDGRPASAERPESLPPPWTAVARGARRRGAAGVSAERLLASAQRGVVVVGDGGDPRAVELAARLRWPLIAEPSSGARVPPALGCAALLLDVEPFLAAHRPDVVVVSGKPGLSRPLLRLLAADVLQVRFDPFGRWWDPTRRTNALVPGGVGEWLDDLDEVSGAGWPPTPADPSWAAAWCGADGDVRAAVDAVLDADDVPSEPRTARDLVEVLAPGDTLVVASSRPVRDVDLFATPRADVRVVANRGASGIDGFVSTALGVALEGGARTTALTGDLSLLHDANGLVLGPGEPRSPLVLVVVNNDGGGIFSFLPYAGREGFERLFGTPHGVSVEDVARVGRHGYGRVRRASELAGAVDAAHAAGGITLLEVRTDREATAALHARVRAAAAAALGRGGGSA